MSPPFTKSSVPVRRVPLTWGGHVHLAEKDLLRFKAMFPIYTEGGQALEDTELGLKMLLAGLALHVTAENIGPEDGPAEAIAWAQFVETGDARHADEARRRAREWRLENLP